MRRLTRIFLMSCLLLSVAPVVSAQFSGLSGSSNTQLTLFPRFPEPNESVTVSLNDYAVNTSGGSIAWYVDGTLIDDATNLRSIQVPSGDLGSNKAVSAVVSIPGGGELTASKTITPIRTDILVEANTITPHFYNGRSLPTSGSEVRVTALPFTGPSTDPASFSYTWTVSGEVIGGGAQRGNNSVTFRSQFERATEVKVDVYTTDGNLLTSKTTIIPISDPELYFYEVNPLRGLLETALDEDYIFVGEEILVRAVPYHFDATTRSDSTLTEWELDGQTINNPSTNPLEITLRRQGVSGNFRLGFHIRNLNQLLQGVEDSITIRY